MVNELKNKIMDYLKETFPLNHFVLYCKGWYQPVKDEKMFETVSKVLELDGYEFAKTSNDIMCIILSEIDRYNTWLVQNGLKDLKLFDLYNGVNKTLNWYNHANTFEEAILYKIIQFIQDKGIGEIVLKRPIYSKKLRKKGLRFSQLFRKDYHGMTYAEQNRIASKIFDE